VKRPHKVFTYLDDDEMAALQKVAEDDGTGIAATLRKLVRQLMKRKKRNEEP
jgi:CHASE3 domain sensor protein